MSANTSYRLSGAALLIGAALTIANLVIQGWFVTESTLTTMLSPLDYASNEIAIAGGVFVLLGLPGMYARQAERAGILGLLGFVCVWYVTLMQSVVLPFGNLSFMSDMDAHLIPAKAETLMTPPPVWGPFFMLSMVGQALGILLLAIAILRAGVFPRWIGWTLVATLVLGIVSFTPFVPEAVSNLTGILANVAIGGVGAALLTQALGASESAQPARERLVVA
ncbi:MAG TPA: hypothetical protein VFN78_13775 [Ktedonobacterales bacterium]|nr:hypothetical protein [Ktedonobacterales bacterium]